MSTDSIGSPVQPLQTVIPSYLYQQFSDDESLQAFVSAYNELSQSYLTWFNATPLAVYTSPNISGPLLDWIGQGVYGIARPVFSTLIVDYTSSAVNSLALNTIAVNGVRVSQSGTAVVANDDYYKRVLTWATYIGNGRYFSIPLLRLKIARFLYGVNGTDVTLDQAQNVVIQPTPGQPADLSIAIPVGTSSTYFQQALQEGILAFPFQLNARVTIGSPEIETITVGASANVAEPGVGTKTALASGTVLAKTTKTGSATAIVATHTTVGASANVAGMMTADASAVVTGTSIATIHANASANVVVANKVVKVQSGTSFTIPSDFGSLVSIECVGGGQSGETGVFGDLNGLGGAGADYAKIISLPGIAIGNVYATQTGSGGTGSFGAGGDTWFDSTTTVLAKGGGSSSTTTGSTTYDGGGVGVGLAGGSNQAGGGGGGAAGPNGNGTDGANASSVTAPGAGGSGDAGSGGVGGTAPGGTGGTGSEWELTAGGTAGSGGGGAGGSDASTAGGAGGNYGGGGGGAGVTSGAPGVPGNGAPGIIIFTYVPTT